MTATPTTNKYLLEPAISDTGWGTTLNTNFSVIDAAFGNVTTINLTGVTTISSPVSTPITMVGSFPPASNTFSYVPPVINLTGTLGNNVAIIIPAGVGGAWTINNLTSNGLGGPYTVTFYYGSLSGGSQAIQQGFTTQIYSDGTSSILLPNTSITSGFLPLTGGTITGNLTINGTTIHGTGDGTSTVTGATIRAPNATGTNTAGVGITIAAGTGTGTGGGGYLTFQTASAGSTGTTANTLTERVRIDNAGNFVLGSGDGTATTSATALKVPDTTGTNVTGLNLVVQAGNGTGTGGSGSILFKTAPVGTTGTTPNTLATVLSITPAGYVGINTGSPTAPLTVVGAASISGAATIGGALTLGGLLSANGATGSLASLFPNIAETTTIVASAATGTINYDLTTQSILYYTTNAAGNFTLNFRGNSTTTLNTVLGTNQSISAVFMNTNGSAPTETVTFTHTSNTVTFSNGSANITQASGTLPTVNSLVTFTTTGGLPTNFTVGINYYVVSSAGTIFTVSATQGGTAIVAGSAGTGTQTAHQALTASGTVAVASGAPVSFSGTVPTGLSAGTTYYAVNPSGNTFQVASTVGGAALPGSTNGSGTITATLPPYYNTVVQIDGTPVTPKWQGGSAPTGGNASSVDAYTYTVVKTSATPTYVVLASQTQFA